MSALAIPAVQSVHVTMPVSVIYVRRSYKESTAADVSDEMQEQACRAVVPAGAQVRVISDSGGHNSGFSADRDGYQALLAALGRGEVAAIAVYDLSRLARNTKLMLDLKEELERRQVPLLVANLPGASFDGAAGRYMFGQFCMASQFQRDLDSERMTRIQRHLFEDGRHRGHDPFGYRSRRDSEGKLAHPRELLVVPEEAAIVRRVFAELAADSYIAVADNLNRQGVFRRGAPWTPDSLKDIVRRGRLYLGNVIEKRGREERPGRHEPILSEAEYARTIAAIEARTRLGNKPLPFRSYALRGLVVCTCGTRMRGEAHLQRGTEVRYYRCPNLACRARRCPAKAIETEILRAIGDAILPPDVIDEARAALRRRVETPGTAEIGRVRARLEKHLEQLRKQHSWGDISDSEYLAERDKTTATLAALPDGDRIRQFDAFRAKVLALPEAIAAASPARREELCRLVVEGVVVNDRRIEAIVWTPPARPFFAEIGQKRQRACPQGALGTRPLLTADVLAWYAA